MDSPPHAKRSDKKQQSRGRSAMDMPFACFVHSELCERLGHGLNLLPRAQPRQAEVEEECKCKWEQASPQSTIGLPYPKRVAGIWGTHPLTDRGSLPPPPPPPPQNVYAPLKTGLVAEVGDCSAVFPPATHSS